MNPPVCSPRRIRVVVLALVAVALGLTGCQEYYIPPPPVSVIISSPTPSLINPYVTISLAVQDATTGQISVGTQQFTATVTNASTTAVHWSIIDPVDGLKLPNGARPDGSAPFGRIDNTGMYTAPPALPSPSTFAVEATSQADTTQSGQVGVQLVAPTAIVSSVSVLNAATHGTVAAMTQGGSYLLDIKGTFLYPGTVVKLSGGSAGAVQFPANASLPLNEIKVPVAVNAAGLLPLQVVNPSSTAGNPWPLVSQPDSPAGSSALGVVIEQVGSTQGAGGSPVPVLANKIYVPQTTANSLAVINGDTGQRLRNGTGQPISIPLPSGFAPSATAANPAHDSIVAISNVTNQLVVVDAIRDTVVATYSLPVSGTATFSDEVCGVCSALVDSGRNEAILATASGFMTVNLATGSVAAPITAPAAENFAYDPATRRVFAPVPGSSGSVLDVIDLAHGTVSTVQLPASSGFSLGSTLNAAALDPTTLFAIVADLSTSEYTGINFNGVSAQGGSISAPAAQFQITSACNGDWDAVAIEAGSHDGFFGNNGACLGVASLPDAPGSGVMTLPNLPPPGQAETKVNIRWAHLGQSPDGLAWTNATEPHAETVFVGLNGTVYGLALRQDQAMLARVDLLGLQNAPLLNGRADTNQVDITVTPQPVLFIPVL